MQVIRTYTCEDCGHLTTRRFRVDRARVCLDCGIARAAAAAVELARCKAQGWPPDAKYPKPTGPPRRKAPAGSLAATGGI